MSYKLVITPYQEGIISILYDEQQKPVEIQFSGASHASKAGNIYIGRVKDVVKHVNGAFLDLGSGITGYYPIDAKALPFYTKKGSSKEIQQGDELLVQIKKEAVKTKDPAVTSEISVSSVYFVAFLNNSTIHYSGKMGKEAKERISMLLSSFDRKGFGLIVRTNAAEATESELLMDLQMLLARISHLKEIAPFRPGASLLYEAPQMYLTMIRNTRQDLLSQIITDDAVLFEQIQTYLAEYQPLLKERLRFYQDRLLSLANLYSIPTHMEEALQPKIWLKSGAYLVLQETEALTVVDVNSGKYSARKSKEEAFLKINLEAAREIARQLRLRNISGIIIVDFINMKSDESDRALLREFQHALSTDPQKAMVIDMTPLGLVEVTRQRTLGTIREQMRENHQK